MNPAALSQCKKEVQRLIEGQDLAANETLGFDNGVMGGNLHLLLIGLLKNPDEMWCVKAFLESCKEQLQGFDF